MARTKEEFVERYRHVLRSIVLDGFIRRGNEDSADLWRRIENQARKVDDILGKMFDELTVPVPQANVAMATQAGGKRV